jgi:phenylpropionate dioxygenase-like ring-hydroxylating dioxygenase large terminal subunit
MLTELTAPLDDTAARLSPEAFAKEQDLLGKSWTFLGLERDIPNTNDWFTAELGGRSVVIQRFEAGIRGFENRCRHRGYPLRIGKKGNGALVCGFHHWRYNADGLALGIPECPTMFGKTPRELDARLDKVEIAQAGSLLFGRFAGGADVSLEAWLGPAFPIIEHVTKIADAPSGQFERVVHANWRYMMDISLDDYHIVAVHPTTFGKGGYIPDEVIHYARFGAHSAYLAGGNSDTLAEMAEQCRAGTWHPTRYRIFQIFPSLIVSVVWAVNYLGDRYWFLALQHLTPEAHDRTRSLSRFFAFSHEPAGVSRNLVRRLAWPTIKTGFRLYARRVHVEDNEACEKLQKVARPGDPPPFIAKQEQRVAWFSDSYRRVLSGERMSAE